MWSSLACVAAFQIAVVDRECDLLLIRVCNQVRHADEGLQVRVRQIAPEPNGINAALGILALIVLIVGGGGLKPWLSDAYDSCVMAADLPSQRQSIRRLCFIRMRMRRTLWQPTARHRIAINLDKPTTHRR